MKKRARFTVGVFVLVATALAGWRLSSPIDDGNWRASLREGRTRFAAGSYSRGIGMLETAFQEATQRFTTEDVRVDRSARALVAAYEKTGRARDAEAFLFRLLALRAKLGRAHPALARTLETLGDFYRRSRRPRTAEPIYRRALRIRERNAGSDQAAPGRLMLKIAALCQADGRDREAAGLYARGLALQRRVLGPGNATLRHASGQYRTLAATLSEAAAVN